MTNLHNILTWILSWRLTRDSSKPELVCICGPYCVLFDHMPQCACFHANLGLFSEIPIKPIVSKEKWERVRGETANSAVSSYRFLESFIEQLDLDGKLPDGFMWHDAETREKIVKALSQ